MSYELLSARFGSSGFTPDVGIYQTFINNTGTSVKGTIVVASSSVDNAVDIAPANSSFPIGVVFESGVSNGSSVKVVIYGKAQVLLKNSETSTHGYWCGVSDVNGRMYELVTVPNVTDHWKEVGHSLETKTGGTDVLVWVQVHFN